jgi:hypothetical protein
MLELRRPEQAIPLPLRKRICEKTTVAGGEREQIC